MRGWIQQIFDPHGYVLVVAFMISFVELCYTLVTSGMNFYNIESMVIESYAKKIKH